MVYKSHFTPNILAGICTISAVKCEPLTDDIPTGTPNLRIISFNDTSHSYAQNLSLHFYYYSLYSPMSYLMLFSCDFPHKVLGNYYLFARCNPLSFRTLFSISQFCQFLIFSLIIGSLLVRMPIFLR